MIRREAFGLMITIMRVVESKSKNKARAKNARECGENQKNRVKL